MKLKDQVCSLKLAKQLKELGVEQESLFYWSDESTPKESTKYEIQYKNYTIIKHGRKSEYYSAFTVAELGEGELLPRMIKIDEERYFYSQFREEDKGEWQSNYESYNDKGKSLKFLLGPQEDDTYTHITEKTEADARAKMLVYLIENKLIND